MQALKEKGKPAVWESRIWVYASAKRACIQPRCFEFHDSQSEKWAKACLEGFSGVLITDTAATTRSRRRSMRDAGRACAGNGWMRCPKAWTQRPARLCDQFCLRLLELEQAYEKLPAEDRLRQHKEKSGPVLEAHRKWPSEDAPLCVSWAWRDCTQVENIIRPFVVVRKGWLFADTPQGTEASTIIYLLMETAKANNLRLDDYLLHLFSISPERTGQRKDFARQGKIRDLLTVPFSAA